MRKIIAILIMMLLLNLLPSFAFAATGMYREGDHGQEIVHIQTKLKQLGYDISRVNGMFTAETTRAVKEFQKKQGIKPADGMIDVDTYHKLMGSISSVKSDGSYAIRISNTAQRYIGAPYRFGGVSPTGFDCSGFVWYVFNQNGKSLPRTADVQFKIGKPVFQNELQRGDLVFFSTYEPGPSHCGIYLEAGKFIHASSSRGIMISKLDDVYWKPRYIGAKRII